MVPGIDVMVVEGVALELRLTGGFPADGIPADGIPADGIPADGIPAEGTEVPLKEVIV